MVEKLNEAEAELQAKELANDIVNAIENKDYQDANTLLTTMGISDSLPPIKTKENIIAAFKKISSLFVS